MPNDAAAANPTTNTSASCRLLELPAELRHYIYELVFSPKAISLSLPRDKSEENHLKQLPFLLTCRQIRQEAEGIPFSSSHVHVGEHDCETRDFILDHSTGRLESIIYLTLRIHPYDEALDLLVLITTCMPNLKRLRIMMPKPWDDVIHQYHHEGSKVIRAAISKHEHIEHLDYGNQYGVVGSTEMRAVNQEVMAMLREHAEQRAKRGLSTRAST
ncbi:hypothetical protein LTR37_011878 [Vermiconidia calcicola]|uniref:Uncharacterized protein n=1 Tax=Vermiconidia calcicola TaxID=1690605 RepID=A0ACC3N2B7_9PEZI|nr:hypothetical protein LTR37_011878 [Vermiconidia calcicola]